MHDLSRLHTLKSRQKVMQAATILRMYRKDPKANDFLQHEAERVLRKVIYHMRQAVIIGRMAAKDSAQFRLPKRRLK
ncbi:hypothetical protein [Variovorax paradoxus]|uniref:hypothetical protein n=1 Tax=Variovorax paradoxus TaxID=34073 RepID=UPI0027887761|nr:hypothetical protein [Variovorax paradoxus]MDQ0586254.1 hypothetical protein [Variovorax paradoxus]